MLRSHRDPEARIAWVAVIRALPLIVIIAYMLLRDVQVISGVLQRAALGNASATMECRVVLADITSGKIIMTQAGGVIAHYDTVVPAIRHRPRAREVWNSFFYCRALVIASILARISCASLGQLRPTFDKALAKRSEADCVLACFSELF